MRITFESIPFIPTSRFTFENSVFALHVPQPISFNQDRLKDKNLSLFVVENGFDIVGWNPLKNNLGKTGQIAIMLYSHENEHEMWQHFCEPRPTDTFFVRKKQQ